MVDGSIFCGFSFFSMKEEKKDYPKKNQLMELPKCIPNVFLSKFHAMFSMTDPYRLDYARASQVLHRPV